MTGRETFLKYYQAAQNENRKFLLENEAAEVCRSYRLPLPEGGFASDKEEALSIAERLGYPVVMKVVSPQVIHKSDVEGVRVGIATREQLAQAYDGIVERVKKFKPEAEIKGQVIAKMAGEGVETIVGLKRDEVLGPVVMFGMGGIFVEVYQDVTFRLCPVGKEEVEEMLSEVKGFQLLGGFRGMAKADTGALKKVILAVCALGTENPEVGAVDLNPVLVNGEGALALDTRIILQ
ncbi:MAG: acetate--CoA ligase family protein [Acidobacteria bacterium]|nr:acetate--CoA ligase family protein [Acidobacteriota bacterium]MCZ6876772.1 acetate--CoA ligase family protein [Acidobacteriota bacterium]